MGKENKPKKVATKKVPANNLQEKAKLAVRDAGAGLQHAGKAVVEKGKELRKEQIEKVEKRRDDLYLANQHIGIEQLEQIRAVQPDATPYATWKLLEKSFIHGATMSKDEEQLATLHQEFVLTAIELYGGKKLNPELRRGCIGLIESKMRAHKIKKNAGRAINVALTLADIAITFIPGVQNAKFLKNAKHLKKINLKKVIPFMNRALPFLRNVLSRVDSSSPGAHAAKRTIEQVQEKLGPAPKTWPKSPSPSKKGD